MTDTNLGTVIVNPRVRAAIYATYVILLVAAGAVSAGFLAVSTALPGWLIATTAVLTYLGVPVGGLALANTTKKV